MTHQTDLFADFGKLDLVPEFRPTDPHVVAKDVRRLTGQNLAILERLRKGPATNVELAQVAMKYTSRISDIRAKGYRIDCERLDGGVTRYRLVAG